MEEGIHSRFANYGYNGISVTRLGDFCTLGNFLKPVATIILPKLPTFEAIFVKVSKSFDFLVKSFLGRFNRHLATFYWSHCSGPIMGDINSEIDRST